MFRLAGIERKRDVVADGKRFEQREMLEHHADAERACVAWIGNGHKLPVPANRPGIWLDDAVDDFHQRRFAGAIFAKHRVDLSGHDAKIDAVVGDDAGIGLGDAGELQARAREGHGWRTHRSVARTRTRAGVVL